MTFRSDPAYWNRLRLRAVVGIQRGDHSAATAYLQFVERERSREVALAAKQNLVYCAKHPAFAKAAAMLAKLEAPHAHR